MTELIIVALATWQAVEIWHHSGLFASQRARVEESDSFGARLLSCPFCLSVWVAAITYLWFIIPLPEIAGVFNFLCFLIIGACRVLVYALAISRLANLGNDLTYNWCRTPRPSDAVEDEPKTTFESDAHDDRPVHRNAFGLPEPPEGVNADG